ncbi:MAG: M60 family metallopeptidase [Muribaculaceae bacterium]|nr:M60 family metallopeptidase [Muribaculaceae bacterium]
MNFYKTLILFLIFSSCASLSAQEIESGKVYKIKNVDKTNNSMSISSSSPTAIGAVSDANDLKQQWYLFSDPQDKGFYFRNVYSGGYLSSPRALYTPWSIIYTNTPQDDTMLMCILDQDGHKVIRPLSHNNNYAYAHNDAGNNIVGWLASSAATQWNFEEVPYTDEEIESILKNFENTADELAKAEVYGNHLAQLFTNKACTQLKTTENLKENENYKALPLPLQLMVDKTYSGDWSEEKGDWDSTHANKYRIQLYEPYSEGAAAASLAGIQAYTNMNNPTGIVGNAGDILYIMVDKEPADGSTLYIGGVPDCKMYNSTTSGTKLHQGLNMIFCNDDNTHYFIYYTVNTVNGKERVRKLSSFEPIKIHIEGGQLNGFFNYIGDELYEPDTEADYRYTVERAVHPMYDLLGRYVILHFFKEDTPNVPTETTKQMGVRSSFDPAINTGEGKHYDPVITMKAWDDMCFAERILMGIQSDEDINNPFNEGKYTSILNDVLVGGEYKINLQEPYSDYFNNRMMGITLQDKGLYMNATAWRTAYAPGTISVILSQFPQAGIWGPAHEYGHINQTPMRIAGTTEESNNVFSNVANYYVCRTTSRCDYPSSQLNIFNQGKTYLEHGTWGTTRMFWQLWCYYHATGHNTKFYPRLYELLRNYPLHRDLTSIPGKLNPKTDLLHFAKMCCVAAQEDLTDFFTAWGFFVPQDNYHIDDYDVYDCILTQEDIDEVKAEIKAFGFPENRAIILIDDRVDSELPIGFGYNQSLCGDLGGLNDFRNCRKAEGDLTFIVDGNNVTVKGEGNPGVGFLVTDEEGNLIGFSNSYNFTLSPEAAEKLMNGTATLMAIGADNETVEVVDPVRNGNLETKKALLKELIDKCDSLLAEIDATECKVGWLLPSSCEILKEERDDKYLLWENAEENDSEILTEGYMALALAYQALLNDEEARIGIEDGASYQFVNAHYQGKVLEGGLEKALSKTLDASLEEVPEAQKWVMEKTQGMNAYYLRNKATDLYLSTSKKMSNTVPMSTDPQSYTLVKIENGIYSFAPDGNSNFAFHIDASNNVVQWYTTAKASQWNLTKVGEPDDDYSMILDVEKDSESSSFDIYDITGRLMKLNVGYNYVTNLRPGVYILKGKEKAKKIVIK